MEYLALVVTGKPDIKIGIAILLAAITMCSAIIAILIFPIIFNYNIIPNIEKKVGKRLQFNPVWEYFLFGSFMFRYGEIMSYIIFKFLLLKIMKNQDAIPIKSNLSLQGVNYRIENASRMEIIMSFLAVINLVICTASLIMANVLVKIK